MKNMRVSLKLIVGFLMTTALAAIVGAVGIIGMLQINNGASDMYVYNTEPMPDMSQVIENLQRIRVNVRDYVLAMADERVEDAKIRADIEEIHNTINAYIADTSEHLNTFEATIRRDDIRQTFERARTLLGTDYRAHLERCYEHAVARDMNAIMDELDQYKQLTNDIVDDFTQCMEWKVEDAANANEAAGELFTMMLVVILVVLAAAIVISIFLALYISSLISKPLLPLAKFMNKAGSTGDLTLTKAEQETMAKYGQVKDEIGQTINSSSLFVNRITDIGEKLTSIAQGDLTQDVALLSEQDTMGTAMRNMLNNLNKMFADIQMSSNQVSSGSVQISDGAQLLAQGATEQSATIQQLSASITEIADQTNSNSGTANEARDLGEEIKKSAEQGNQQMEQMMRAVQEINESSKSISKVIKIIDDIAFQTNILALNAAVEAARAGQHGKGFAVVADEVRSLAAKSAEAAKNTNELIETSIQKAEQGAAISQETSESLKKIVEGILRSSELIAEIAKSSENQSIAIAQVSDGIGQVSQVVQQNSATAEESAAASEEMSGQASLLQELISQFRLKDQGSMQRTSRAAPAKAAAPAPAAPIEPTDPSTGYAISDGSKY